MTNIQVLSYVRDELLSDPYIDAEFAWNAFRMAEQNGDMEYLFNRWMMTSVEERIFVENLMKELLTCNTSR